MSKIALIGCMCALLPNAFGAPAALEESSGKIDPNVALKREVEEFSVDTTLEDAFAQYEKLAGVKIVVDWDALKEAGVEKDTDVTLMVRNVTVAKLLKMTLANVESEASPLVTYVDRGVVRVTSRKAMLREIRLARAVGRRDDDRTPSTPGEIDMQDVPFSDVITFLRDASGINFQVDYKALNLVGIDRDTPVTIQAKGITFARVLDLLTDQLGAGRDKFERVYWVIDSGVVRISTGEALNRKLRTKVYDVAHLLLVVPDFESPRLDFDRMSNNREREDEDSESIWRDDERDNRREKREDIAEKRERTRENLIGIIKDSIGKDMWQDGGGKGSIRMLGKKLVVSQTLLGFKLMEESFR